MIVFEIGFDPIIAQIGAFQLGWHALFTALGVLAGVWLALWLAARRGISTELVGDIATWAVVGGIVGARLFHVADHLDFYLAHPLQIFAVWEGGIAVYGAFIGGTIAGAFAAWRAHADPWPLLDLAAPAMLVGQMIGRLGCLSNGDAWGANATGCTWCVAVIYTHPNALLPDELRGVPTYAYPLYEIALELVLLAGLWLFRRSLARRPGLAFLVTVIGYAGIRFSLTYLRQEPILLAGLQEAQLIAVLTAAVAIGVLIWRALGAWPGAPSVDVSAQPP
jgi:phosphatidylglycerol:prolipoprotein diacylglycerol transferase